MNYLFSEKPMNKVLSELVLSINRKPKHPIMKKMLDLTQKDVSGCYHGETWEKFSCKLILLGKSILI